MKTKSIINRIAQIATITLFCANVVVVRAAEPEIVINSIPPLGQNGYAEGKVVWSELTPGNVGQYAVIAMLHATWPGGGGYYVKPTNNAYLNTIDSGGNFSMLITTGGVDADADEVFFYLVERTNFNGINGEMLNTPSTMTSKYLASTTIYRSSWVPLLTPSINPGLVAVDTAITLLCKEGATIHYTLDGSAPLTSSSSQIYNNNVFTVPGNGALLVKAVVEISGLYSSVYSFAWLPKEPLVTPFWGLNVSLALNDEVFGHKLTEEITRERMAPITQLTKWIRTFGTINNGHEYINKIAKESGSRTMIGVYITNNASDNNAQIEGLRHILETGPVPDLIAIGNEASLLGVGSNVLAACIDEVREMVLAKNFVIPIGSVDIAGAPWSPAVVEKLDFIGVNIYSGTWDDTPVNQMFNVMTQSYENNVSGFSSKLVLLTETGTPYNGGTYSLPDNPQKTQTASEEKAADYLCNFLDWVKQGDVPAFYFEAYDEPTKSQENGHIIEQYFGIMDGNLAIHSFYQNCLPNHFVNIQPIHSTSNQLTLYPNPTSDNVFLETEGDVKVYNTKGLVLQELFNSNQVDLSAYPQGLYFLQVNEKWNKVVKK